MKELSFKNAGLEAVPREVFEHAATLEALDLSGNRLSALPDEFARLTSLRRLFVSSNPVEELPRVLGQLSALEMVGFKSCRLRHVADDALPARLRWLILTDNQLERLPESLGQRPRLQKLALAGNRLRALPASMSQASALELLRISANQLETFPRALLELPRLAWLAFAGNPFCRRPEVTAEPVRWSSLKLHDKLGAGASGVVWRAMWGEREVAVKVFNGAVTSDGLPEDEVCASLLAGAHPNLVATLGRVVDHPDGADALVLSLIPPSYRALGAPPNFDTCTRDVMPRDLPLTSAALEHIADGIASLGAHLHARGVSHGDLYAHNTRIDAEGHAVMGDFGAASVVNGLDGDVHAGLERIEVRAFGAFVDDLLSLGASPRLLRLRDACTSRAPPSFAELTNL